MRRIHRIADDKDEPLKRETGRPSGGARKQARKLTEQWAAKLIDIIKKTDISL